MTNGRVTIGPTAAGVGVAGMAMSAVGRPVSNAMVTLTGPAGESYVSRTNAFGYFQFANIPSGQDYVIAVASKRYSFTPQVVRVADELVNVNLIAQQ